MKRVLIIKTGFSELLDRGISTTVSLGDVLMCTGVLHFFKKAEVTWVTSWAARDLLKGNPYIARLLIFGPKVLKELAGADFDVLINLEKDIGICTFLHQIPARKRYGFYFHEGRHDIATHKRSDRYLLAGQEHHRAIEKSFLEILAGTVGQKWRGQGLILQRRKRPAVEYDIGFNHAVGVKWPTKAWPRPHWQDLERRLEGKYSISWQQGHHNIKAYIDWIDRCRLLVTADSLGQAVGQALGKQVITLYGPTHYRRMQGIENITVVPSPCRCPHMPCYLPYCKNKRFCMEAIPPQKIAKICERLLS